MTEWYNFDEKLSQTVTEQFSLHCQNLKELEIGATQFRIEQHRANMCELAARILEAQADKEMEQLKIYGFWNKEKKTELTEEDKLFINSIVRSGLTNLSHFEFRDNKTWWGDSEAQEFLCDFIKEQTALE